MSYLFLHCFNTKSLGGLRSETPKVVWTKDIVPDRCCQFWAPEIHNLDGVWYIYYTASTDDANQDLNRRMHALKGNSSNIWDSAWSYAGRLAVPNHDNQWSIDATVMSLSSERYWIYSSKIPGGPQALWIAKMNGPLSLQKGYEISIPTNDWEKVNGSVNEGPAPITHNGRTWIVYSASHCKGPGYSLASLELAGSDPLQMSSWKKSNGTIFTSANGNWAPGHNGFFTSPSGDPWMVYHAYPVPKVRCDDGRQTLAQPIGFNADGSLDLGEPGPRSEDIPEPK